VSVRVLVLVYRVYIGILYFVYLIQNDTLIGIDSEAKI